MGRSLLDAEKLPGFVEDMNYRDFEHFMKCPLRSYLRKAGGLDVDLLYISTLDLVFNKASLMLLTNTVPSMDFLSANFKAHLKALPIVDDFKQALLERAQREHFPHYIQHTTKLLEKYNVISPVTPYSYSNNGVTIEIVTSFTLQEKKGIETFCVLLEYQKVYEWKSYSRLWSAVLKNLLFERGLTRLGVKVLSLPNGELMEVHQNKHRLTSEIMHYSTAMYASRAVYPVYGGHCHRCSFSDECGHAVN